MIQIFTSLSELLYKNPILVSYFTAFFSEELIILLAVISGRGLIPFYILFIFSILGALTIETIFYLIGGSRLGLVFKKRFINHEPNIEKKRYFFYILLSKFIYGTRMASSLYFGMHKMPYKKFLLYNLISSFLWSIIMLPAAYFAGKGFDHILRISRGIEKLGFFILIAIIIAFVINHIVRKILMKSEKSIEDKTKII